MLVLTIVVVGAVVYGTRHQRHGGEELAERPVVTPSGRPSGAAAPAGDAGSPTEVCPPPRAPHEFVEIMDSETGEGMKMRLYSVDEYEGKACPENYGVNGERAPPRAPPALPTGAGPGRAVIL